MGSAIIAATTYSALANQQVSVKPMVANGSIIQSNNQTMVSGGKIIADPQALNVYKKELQGILNQVSFFSADFTQEIKDSFDEVIGVGTGKFSLLKPNYLYWFTEAPDQSLIVSDGDFVWLYDPFIEQATVYQLQASIANTPILLLTSNDPLLWDKFQVTQPKPLTYEITALDANSQIKSLELVFSDNPTQMPQKQLMHFVMEDATGQKSKITLTKLNYMNKPSEDLFKFNLPEGAYLDDQR